VNYSVGVGVLPHSTDFSHSLYREVVLTSLHSNRPFLSNTLMEHHLKSGISRDVLTNDLKLLIDDFGQDADCSRLIRDYHDLSTDYMGRRGAKGVVHIDGDWTQFM